MNLEINLGGKKLILDNVIKANPWLKFRGLMFRSKNNAPVLLFDMRKQYSIHSFFVFFNFIALWLDNNNKVISWKIVKPFSPREKPNHNFSRIIEIPIYRRYNKVINFVVGERFKKK